MLRTAFSKCEKCIRYSFRILWNAITRAKFLRHYSYSQISRTDVSYTVIKNDKVIGKHQLEKEEIPTIYKIL